MEVCIVNTVERFKNGKGWQIMRRVSCGFNHVFPGVLFTLDEARRVCTERGFGVVAVGDMWQCCEH